VKADVTQDNNPGQGAEPSLNDDVFGAMRND
jgi:hypothetical protein